MARTSPHPTYKWLAHHYDEIFEPFRIPLDHARQTLLGPILPSVETACDLACGTATTALIMAGQGIRMFAVDLSPVMCRIARQKARAAGLPLRVIRADMRAFRLPRLVDLVTCEYDAINHIPHKTDLPLVAKSVARALRPGGHFFFDVNNLPAFQRYWSSTFWTERPGVALLMRGGVDAPRHRAWIDADIFSREGALWRRHHERVEEVCWNNAEIRGALRAAGFSRIRAWDSTPYFDSNSPVQPGCRTIYLARKSSA